jgi:hypothetical protein
MSDKQLPIKLSYWIDSVDSSAELSGQNVGILKLEGRHFFAPGEVRTYPHQLELVIDEQQLDQLLYHLQNLKKVMA